MIRAGGFKSSFKLVKIGRKFFASVKGLSWLDEDRRKNMAGKRYLYLMSLAVDPEYQRKGIANNLLKAMFEKTDSCGYYTYVSADLDNVNFYKKHGDLKSSRKLTLKLKIMIYLIGKWFDILIIPFKIDLSIRIKVICHFIFRSIGFRFLWNYVSGI